MSVVAEIIRGALFGFVLGWILSLIQRMIVRRLIRKTQIGELTLAIESREKRLCPEADQYLREVLEKEPRIASVFGYADIVENCRQHGFTVNETPLQFWELHNYLKSDERSSS